MKKRTLATSLAFLIVANSVFATDVPSTGDKKTDYSPYTNNNFPQNVYFGDTHLNTSFSTDAGMVGNTVGLDDAYRFARGEVITQSHGLKAKLQRPLDFQVITDHAENLGLAQLIRESNPDLLKNAFGKKVHDLVKAEKGPQAYNEWLKVLNANNDPLKGSKAIKTMWQRITAAAEKYNAPGLFTAMIGFEWTSIPDGAPVSIQERAYTSPIWYTPKS